MVKTVLGPLIFWSADACDLSMIIHHEIRQTLGKQLKVQIVSKNETLINVIIINSSNTKRRLVVYVIVARDY